MGLTVVKILKILLLCWAALCLPAQAKESHDLVKICDFIKRVEPNTPILECEDQISFIHFKPFNLTPPLAWSEFLTYIQTQDISASVGPEHMAHFFELRDAYDRGADSVGFDLLNAMQFADDTQSDYSSLRIFKTLSYMPLVGIEKLISEHSPNLRTPDPMGGQVFVMLGSLHGSPIAIMYWAGGPLNATKAHVFYQIYIWS